MLTDNPYLFFVCALGVFNCFLISVYFLVLDRPKRSQNLIFGVLTFLLSIRIGKTVYMSSETTGSLTFAQIGLSACFLIGVTLFYYLKASLENPKKIPLSWILHFLALFLFIVLIGVVLPYTDNTAFWNQYLFRLIYAAWGLYILLSGLLLKDRLRRFISNPIKTSVQEQWMLLVFTGNLLLFLAYLVGYFWLLYVEMITFSVVFYVLMVFYLTAKDKRTIFREVPPKYGAKKIDVELAEELIQRLTTIMEKERLYQNPALKLEDVATKLEVSNHKLSQLLNDNLGQSFSSYINRQRVHRAIELLRDNRLFTLEAIGYEAGFVSKSGFYATFKRVTGKTPSHFRNPASP